MNKIKKKRSANLRRILVFVGVLFITGSTVKAYYDTNVFKVHHVQFQSDKIASNTTFSILQISDVHNKMVGNQNERLIETVKEVDADIIVLTGDLIDRKTNDFTDVFAFVENLKAIDQHVFFVTGNHEWDHANTGEFLAGLHERGIIILGNEHAQVTIGDATLNLVGIDNESTNHENINLAFEGVDSNDYTVLLSHSPGVVLKYDVIPADLILSGHTHGGQVRLPGVGALVAPDQGFFPELDKGVFEFNEGQYLYIDSDLGTSVAPIRFWNQSQVSLIEVVGE